MSDVVYLFGGWEPLARIAVVGVLGYVFIVALLRVTGNRTLASMSAFDFIVTVAMGAVFGRAVTAHEVALAELVWAFALLVGLQYAVTWLKVRWPVFARVVTARPVLLYYRGELLRDAMRRVRVSEPEVRAWVRKEGHGALEDVDAVVLESDGQLAVVTALRGGGLLDGVEGASETAAPEAAARAPGGAT